MEINVSKIESDIYQLICQDFAEYCTNRMKVYEGVIDFLKFISLKELLNTPSEKVYELYVEHCEKYQLSSLTNNSFAKVMNGMCGFDIKRVKEGAKRVQYYALGEK